MARFPFVSPESAGDPTVQRVYREIERELGFGIVPNVFQAMAHVPGVLDANWLLFKSIVLQGSLPRTVKEMVGVVVSAVHGSDYARLVHMHSLGVQGVSQEVLGRLAAGEVEIEGVTPAVVAMLRFAKRAAEQPAGLTDADHQALADVGLSTAEVFELIATIELFTAVNLFTDVAGVEIDSI